MATFTHLEGIEAWNSARALARAIYTCSKGAKASRDYSFCDRVRRAATSVMLNIAEGFERGGNREFVQFLGVAKGSPGEIEALLYVALDQGDISQGEFESMRAKNTSTRRLIAGLMHYLRRSGMRGMKYKGPRDPNQEPRTRNQERG